ncbi:MAG: AlpA family transcriptional regulator [Thermoanaerobaculia bacterium]|nr:AlpA family transcriptional regulator [Thermoanaerobaculia bacterium]
MEMRTVRLLRRAEVERRTGLGRSSLYALMSCGDFPRPARLGARAVGWSEAEIEEWCAQRLADRQPGAA